MRYFVFFYLQEFFLTHSRSNTAFLYIFFFLLCVIYSILVLCNKGQAWARLLCHIFFPLFALVFSSFALFALTRSWIHLSFVSLLFCCYFFDVLPFFLVVFLKFFLSYAGLISHNSITADYYSYPKEILCPSFSFFL